MSTNTNKWFSGRKTFCLITGASRSLGKVLAIKIAENVGKDSLLLLVARDERGLQETKDAVGGGVQVSVRSCDLATPDFDHYVSIIQEALSEKGANANDFEEIAIIHNAATLGDFQTALTIGEKPSDWDKYFALNLTSPACLNSAFFKVFAGVNTPKLVINVSSLAAVRPHSILSLYCTGKAARRMYFATLALDEPTITVLNYAPGPLDTDMFHSLNDNMKEKFPEKYGFVQKILDNGTLLTCEMTTEKMLSILKNDNFTSGCHIDYYDP